MNRATFYTAIKAALPVKSLTESQVDGFESILDEAERQSTPSTHLAYMLATAWHETATAMQPVIETRQPKEKQNPTVDQAIARLEKSFKAGKLTWVKTPYWRKDADGKSWLGRGLPQLTHKANYLRMSQILGVDLIGDPNKALELETAIKIMFVGMTKGSFTNKKLADYLDGPEPDFINARRIINGTESAGKIAVYATKFHDALTHADYGAKKATQRPTQAVPEPETPTTTATYGTAPQGEYGWLSGLLIKLAHILNTKG